MKYIKNMPVWLANTIFIKTDKNDKREIVELSRTQIDIFFLLIFETSKSYDHDKNIPKKLIYSYEKPLIEETLDRDVSTLKEDMKKISGLEIVTNIFESYGDNSSRKYKPFSIKEVKNSKGIINYFITVQENFIKQFTHPNPKFTLDYQYLTNLINPQAKLLYILLFNQLGKVNIGTKKGRNIEVEMLLLMLNKNPDKKNAQLQRDINKYIKSINEHTDIEVELNKDITDTDIDENGKMIEKVKKSFTITRIKDYPKYIKVSKGGTKTTKLDEFRGQAEILLAERKKDEYLNNKYGTINNDEAWLKKTIKDLSEKEQKKQAEQDEAEALKKAELKKIEEAKKAELEESKRLIDKILEDEKNKLRNKLDDKKGVPLIAFQMYNILDEEDMYFYINQDYQFINQDVETAKCNDANETYKYLMKYTDEITVVIKHTDCVYDLFEKMYFNM